MEEASNKQNEISAEYALSDALDNICKYLKIKDLITLSLVCKSWYTTAMREIMKRGPERVLIPHILSEDITNANSNFHVGNILNAKPYIALLFVGPSLRERDNRNLEYQILAIYKKYFPHYLVTVGVDECMMDENVIISCPGLLGAPNGILGLFLPLYRDLKIKVASCLNYRSSNAAEMIVNKLLPESKETKSTLILFSNSYEGYCIANKTIKLIKKKFIQKMYTLWGGIFDDDLKATKHKTIDPLNSQTKAVFALSISGSSIASWSIVVDCCTKKSEIDQKLLNLKEQLNLRQYTIGLACGPRYVEDLNKSSYENMYHNSHELMNTVKQIFRYIPFIGIFNFGYHNHFGVDSVSDDCNQELASKMSMALMILTYD